MPIDLAPAHYFVVSPAGSTADGSATLQGDARKEIPWHRPLPQRLRIALNLGVLCCFLVAGLLLAWIRASHVADQAQDQLRAEARVVAAGMAVALLQEDRVDMRGLLESMVHRRDFAAVAIHDGTGNRLAAYAKSRDKLAFLPSPNAAPASANGFFAQRFPATILLREPVRHDGAVLGMLVLYADLGARWHGFYGEMAWICAALLLSLLLCAALVNLVQQHIVDPVYRLERTCKVIVEDRDYTLRAWKAARDEVGTVADCVNHLLDEVHHRGTALVEARGEIARALATAPAPVPATARSSNDASAVGAPFLANMCHEIRTPLNRAGALCRDLAASELTTVQRDLVSAVHATGDLVIALLDDLLDYTRLESGTLEMHLTEFDPQEVVETIMRMYDERARAKNLRLSYTREGVVPARVRGDRARLRQVIGTMVGNAIKYAQAGEISIALRAPASGSDGTLLRIDVLDSGFGIAEEARQRVHQALTQSLQGHGAPSGSAGLGITIANHLIQRMGGTLSLCEGDGGRAGFSFCVQVEAVAVAVAADNTAAPAKARKTPPPASTTVAEVPARAPRSRRSSAKRTSEPQRRAENARTGAAAPDLMHQVAEVYLDSAPELFESLRHAIECGTSEEILEAAHMLGTCSARVGANQVADLCRLIEGTARSGEVAQLQPHFEALTGAFERAKASLTREGAAHLETAALTTHPLSTTLQ